MNIPSLLPSATPPLASTPMGRYAGEAATPQSARVTPTAFAVRPPTAPSGSRPSNGSQTARSVWICLNLDMYKSCLLEVTFLGLIIPSPPDCRSFHFANDRGVEPTQASRLPSATSRQGSTFGGGVAPRASSFTGGAPPMSMRSSGLYGSSSGSIPAAAAAAAPRMSFSGLSRASTAVPASAGGRRASLGQWKS
jgi:hypothetical protein